MHGKESENGCRNLSPCRIIDAYFANKDVYDNASLGSCDRRQYLGSVGFLAEHIFVLKPPKAGRFILLSIAPIEPPVIFLVAHFQLLCMVFDEISFINLVYEFGKPV